MRMLFSRPLGRSLSSLLVLLPLLASAQNAPPRDEFFWLGEINKASLVINTQQGLLDAHKAPAIAQGLAQVLRDGAQPQGKRPSTVISFEPQLIRAAGQDVTLLHAGRSSQDMHATYRAAMLRDDSLILMEALTQVQQQLLRQAEAHRANLVPNYTNGVAAQANSYGHYLLGHAAGFERDAQRLREAYQRLNRSPMGTTVLNGTSWPLDRQRMAGYLGFAQLVDNAYDAGQIASMEHPVELGSVVSSIALHIGHFIEDVMVQYAQPAPWILLETGGGNTYVSSAMPQKRNPGLLNDTRRDASTAITLALGPLIRGHNIPPGMADNKGTAENGQMMKAGITALRNFHRVLQALRLNPQRALEELNSDWTASQELADLLMRKHQLPFRVGHHFASELVDYAKAHNLRPTDFPYAEARRIYAAAVHDSREAAQELPLSEAEFRAALNPQHIVQERATSGGPQPAEMQRMLQRTATVLAEQERWTREQKTQIAASLERLDRDFQRYLPQP